MNKKNLKKLLAMLLALTMIVSLAACGAADKKSDAPANDNPAQTTDTNNTTQEDKMTETSQPDTSAGDEQEETPAADVQKPVEAEPVELIVFAAASLTETLTEIKGLYEAANPNVTLTFNFDSSGKLKTQIEEGADCDLFISAAQKQMNQLDITADPSVNTDGLDYVRSETRIDLLENKVALSVPEGNPAGINSYDDLITGLQNGSILLAMGNSDVPVGQYTQKIFTYFGLDEAALASAGCLTYGGNVKEVTTQVTESTVDCGIIYATDAFSANLTIVDYATAEMCGQVIYPAAVLNVSANPDAAQAFLDYLTGDEATAVFASVGFSAMQ